MKRYPHLAGTILRVSVIVLLVLLAAAKLFTIKVSQRTYARSITAEMYRPTIPVGSQGYGTINAMNIALGAKVNKGDRLFTYIRSDIDEKLSSIAGDVQVNPSLVLTSLTDVVQLTVESPVSGVVKSVDFNEGSYIRREDQILQLYSNEEVVRANFKLKSDEVRLIVPGTEAKVLLPTGETVGARVKGVSPLYNFSDKIASLELSLDTYVDINDKTPVVATILLPDAFATRVTRVIDRIPFKAVRELYQLRQNGY